MNEASIAIVAAPGDPDLLWHGLVQLRQNEGYIGKLISYRQSEKQFDFNFNLPPELDGPAVYMIINGSEYATAIWPRFGSASLNAASKSFEIRIPTLLRGIHAREGERCVCGLTCFTPIFLGLFGIVAFDRKLHTDIHQTSIETKFGDIASHDSSIGKIKLWVGGNQGFSFETIDIKFTGGMTIELAERVSAPDAVKLAKKIETFISILCFSYIHFEKVSLRIKSEVYIPNTTGPVDGKPDTGEATEVIGAEVYRARRYKKAKTALTRFELPLRLDTGFQIGDVLDRFLTIHDQIERSLSWYRIAQIEDRYLEDHFFYSIRMIEALYRALELELPTPKLPREIDRLTTSAQAEPDLVSFIKKRIRPMFLKPSLGAIVSDLRKRYAQLTLTRILDDRWIGKLRNKEAHGTTERYSGRDYRYMAAVRDLLSTIYPCLILEACGMSQDVIFKHLMDGPYEYSRFFDARHTASIEAELLD